MEKQTESTAVMNTATEGNMVPMNEGIADMMGGDLAGLSFTPDRIKIPAGGATAFEIPDDEAEDGTRMAKELTGVIILNHPAFAYYSTQYTGGSNPPDCGSFDGVKGVGNPGGPCMVCKYNRFGSGGGKSKACKNRRMLYIVPEGEMFPMTLSLPAGSLKSFANYVKHQFSRGRTLSGIVTKITLKKAQSESNITFSQAVFSFVRVLEPQEIENLKDITKMTRDYAANLSLTAMESEDDGFVSVTDDGVPIEPLK